MICAAIDIGTNTILLAIAEENKGQLRDIIDLSTIVRLGEGVSNTGVLSEEAQLRTIDALREYLKIISSHGTERIFCVGTAALREAGNARQFIARVKGLFGLDIEIISSRDEAYYTYLSVRDDSKLASENMTIIDIGGGSTEVIHGSQREFLGYASLPMGSVRLTDSFVHTDPPLPGESIEVVDYIRKHLVMAEYLGNRLIGTGGTVTNIASLILRMPRYDKTMIHGFSIQLTDLQKLIGDMSSMPCKVRKDMIGMEAGREDIIIQGARILEEIMVRGPFPSCTVSAAGLRYGLIYERCRKT
ncbi:MAG: Ppx/GppA phosphatase family protein [Syntrophorhabdus sp.]